jgi:sugar phosphate permease
MNTTKKNNYLLIILLILSGEAIFILPFVLVRIFRPVFLEVFTISNTQLGTCFSIYGIVALISYLFGGIIADKFKPKNLMTVALLLTAFGGFFLATFPSITMMYVVYGYWGFTTIFLFWSAMIKATRQWGGKNNQAKAFGFLEGGRGLVAALFGSLGVSIFAAIIPSNDGNISIEAKQNAYSNVLIYSSSIVIAIAVLVFLFLKFSETKTQKSTSLINDVTNIKKLLKLPTVWLLMLIILSGYVGYKVADVFTLYANEVLLFNQVESATIGAFFLYLRPIVCLAVGLFANTSKASKWLLYGFTIVTISSLIFASGIIKPTLEWLFFLSLFTTGLGVYAIRTLYFAVIEETNIPLAITGTAVGLLSLIGYTPDIFTGPVIGYFLDNNPPEIGHQYVFIFFSCFCVLGLISAFLFYKLVGNKRYSTAK